LVSWGGEGKRQGGWDAAEIFLILSDENDGPPFRTSLGGEKWGAVKGFGEKIG
jgi:hypothetical protein